MDHYSYALPLTDRDIMHQRKTSDMTIYDDLLPPTVHYMNDVMFNALAMPSTASEMYTSPLQCQPFESDITNPSLSHHLHPYAPNTSTPANSLEDDPRLVDDILSAFDTGSIVNEPQYAAPLYMQPPPSYLVSQTQSPHVEQIAMSHAQQLSMQSMMARQEIPVIPLQDHSGASVPQIHDLTSTNTQLTPMRTQPGNNQASTYFSALQDSTHSTQTNSAMMISMSEPMSMSEGLAIHHTENSFLAANTTSNSLIGMDACDFSSDHSSTFQPMSLNITSSYLQDTLPQAESFHFSPCPSDEETSDDGNDAFQETIERRQETTQFSPRRLRKEKREEENSLRVRIEELKEQIRTIGDDVLEQCSQMPIENTEALEDAHDKQLITVQDLRNDNEKFKKQLVQHENFARMIRSGLNSLPYDCRDDDQRRSPTLVVDLNICHEAVREAYDEMKRFGPSVNTTTCVFNLKGWETDFWLTGTSLNFRGVQLIKNKNISDVARKAWEIMTSSEKSKRIYPDVKHFRILQKVTDDIVIVHRIASAGSDMIDREFTSVAFQFRDGNDYYIGIKSIDVQAPTSENCIRGEECQGWKFTGSKDNSTQWKAHFVGYYDVKGEPDKDKVNQIAGEALSGMMRWDSEVMEAWSV